MELRAGRLHLRSNHVKSSKSSLGLNIACARKLGQGGSSDSALLKPCTGTLRVCNPARQRLATSRERVLRGVGEPALRSVDSECAGRVIEPRNKFVVGADVVLYAEGSIATLKGG